ncbi:MAG: hypothetical protein D6732_25045, partial [Methanobacteriota archaeon]
MKFLLKVSWFLMSIVFVSHTIFAQQTMLVGPNSINTGQTAAKEFNLLDYRSHRASNSIHPSGKQQTIQITFLSPEQNQVNVALNSQ